MLGNSDEVIVVVETKTSKDILNLLGDEIAVTPELCWSGGIHWEDIRAVVQVLVYVIEKDIIGKMKWIVLW